jgi:hypothetical protein
MNRRKFIVTGFGTIALAGGAAWLFRNSTPPVKSRMIDSHSSLGHMLREGKFPEPSLELKEKIVIAGGGIAGLSAARYLENHGERNYRLLELSDETGGNTASGKNKISEFPWAAHYIPIPNNNQKELLDFLEEHKIITGFNGEGLPDYNEQHLCFDPEERLYLNGYWQEGLIPKFGLNDSDKSEIESFLKLMDEYRHAKGEDGKEAFAIPVAESSIDKQFTSLDQQTMKDFLLQRNLRSPYLHWYIDYCCRDDFGTRYDHASAWAGVHYFAGRKGKGANAGYSDVLTWPEGNAHLAKCLLSAIPQEKRTVSAVVYKIEPTVTGADVLYYDAVAKRSVRIRSEKVIVSTPQFVSKRLVESPGREECVKPFSYSPWMVANITLKNPGTSHGMPLCWDNVIYGSPSLGYVDACHQHLTEAERMKVWTYYLPLCDESPDAERRKAYSRTEAQWVEIIVNDLKQTQPDIEKYIESIDVRLWGHAMIRPQRAFMFSEEKKNAAAPIGKKIFFAHSDLSGISIFEEAFYHGNRAAKELISSECTG